jgi:outer membrane receptor protein involved in Fe transport
LDAYAPVTGIQIVVNGDNARSQGIELEVQAAITNNLSASVGGSYTDAKLTEDFIRANFVGQKGDRLPLVPIGPNTYSTNFQHLGGFTTLNAGVGFQASKELKLRLYCNNLTNQSGITTWSVARQPEQSTEYVTRPRTAGVNVTYSFR